MAFADWVVYPLCSSPVCVPVPMVGRYVAGILSLPFARTRTTADVANLAAAGLVNMLVAVNMSRQVGLYLDAVNRLV